MKTITGHMREIELGMTNFDQSIDECLEAALMKEPKLVFGRHSGWNFNGHVWFEDGRFHEEVWVYGSVREIISADTLVELMVAVSNEYGQD